MWQDKVAPSGSTTQWMEAAPAKFLLLTQTAVKPHSYSIKVSMKTTQNIIICHPVFHQIFYCDEDESFTSSKH